ncbi:hypothetical protein DRB04_30665 (plasmid) [Klebsiella pneumoniae]|uniref:Error-prone, lesion bypass DNA polymerase V (UmuC) n=1 Tax=Klebsiella pneumoniae TaxID=573 RepID=A0A286NC69_KLEPN|nr:Error-prone, lesion bypass DNA polymerase V (UmuC) [Klebsiella pneumoniae]AWU78694.1 Error-prone, lesion bypass DNA polymerase V (UmuC) [Klebsiella pneumoniae]QHP24016.1 hypothetical protein DRB04_30665 [Klebsiella pneumoniae]
MFALIDVNGMYAACESAFRPDLASRAVCCLSNNDGAIVARNRLAKLAGLKMGEPYFKARPLIGGTSENGIYGHSRFCNTDFDDKLACLNLSGV